MNLFRSLGWFELLIILAVVILIFGPGRIGKVAGELGEGIRNFRQGISGDGEEAGEEAESEESSESAE
jgi:sec-independent protein translocase protein TatA